MWSATLWIVHLAPKHHPLSPSHLRLLPQFRKVVKRHWTPTPVDLLEKTRGIALLSGSVWGNITTCSPLATLFANFRAVVDSTWLQSSQLLDLQLFMGSPLSLPGFCVFIGSLHVGSTRLWLKMEWPRAKVWPQTEKDSCAVPKKNCAPLHYEDVIQPKKKKKHPRRFYLR